MWLRYFGLSIEIQPNVSICLNFICICLPGEPNVADIHLGQVRAGELATAEGVSYLEAKHLLLLSYCTNIVFYLLLKAEGRPVRDHPVIPRLVQLRAYLVLIPRALCYCSRADVALVCHARR